MSETAEPASAAPKDSLRVLLVDDHDLFRTGLRNLLEEQGVRVVGEASAGAEAVQLGLQQHPLIALLDVSMPRLGGVEAALTLRSLRPTMEIALQSGDAEEYRDRFRPLLERAVGLAGGEAGRVVVVSIPDWSTTPFARGRDRARIAAEIDRFNAVNREETDKAAARYVDITAISRGTAAPGWEMPVTSDGLHPAGAVYAEWARLILPKAVAALGRAGKTTAGRRR